MKIRYALAALALACPAAASAQSMKPGLWEITHKNQGAAGSQAAEAQAKMQAQMANMSPEQKKMMQEMMAKHGVQMGGAGGGMSIKTCMTREMIDRHEMPQQKGDCKQTSQSKSGNTMKFTVQCTNPPSTAEGQITYQGSEAYTMKMVVNSKVEGRPQTMNMESSGKWLSADCGAIKPPGSGMKK
jgi:hypothetical protein